MISFIAKAMPLLLHPAQTFNQVFLSGITPPPIPPHHHIRTASHGQGQELRPRMANEWRGRTRMATPPTRQGWADKAAPVHPALPCVCSSGPPSRVKSGPKDHRVVFPARTNPSFHTPTRPPPAIPIAPAPPDCDCPALDWRPTCAPSIRYWKRVGRPLRIQDADARNSRERIRRCGGGAEPHRVSREVPCGADGSDSPVDAAESER